MRNFLKFFSLGCAVLLVFAYFIRWDEMTVTYQGIKTVHRLDQWTGQRWIVKYGLNDSGEKAIIDDRELVSLSTKIFKTMPAQKRESYEQKSLEELFPGYSTFDPELSDEILYGTEMLGKAQYMAKVSAEQMLDDAAKTKRDQYTKIWWIALVLCAITFGLSAYKKNQSVPISA